MRVREDIKDDCRKTQHRVKSFLLGQGRRYPGRDKGWSDKFDLWARSQRFEEPAADAAYRHYLAALDVRRSQLATITAEIEAATTPLWVALTFAGGAAFGVSMVLYLRRKHPPPSALSDETP